MISLQEFHQDFLQSIFADAESRGLLRPRAFFENVCEELLTTGDLTNNYTEAEYKKTGIEVHGYDYDEERNILSLLVHQFFQEEELQTLLKTDIDVKFKRLKKFYLKAINGIHIDMEEAYESHSMAFNIYNWTKKNKIDRVKLILITDGKATRNLIDIPSEKYEDIDIEYRVIDIEYLYKIYLSENSSSEFDVEVDIPFLEIETSTNNYHSYLSFLTGETLVNVYEKFGQKLFEQNVRTFLQFRGNVNKGLRNTIEFHPEMFFAYNNGITATATEIETKGNRIIKIKNFQIVNGGQTTSAIYAASKTKHLDVSKVSVQMKLSIVTDINEQSNFVSKVSEYANTQNKINKSDFFSNSPFHKEFKDYSKRIWVSVRGGSQQRTHWFYERVRGEYLNEQAYLTVAQKKKFQIENPKNQKLDKTFLAKSENSWLQKPNIVARGAQYSFANFADTITNRLEKDSLAITESFYKDSISRVILFRAVEKLVSNAIWYNGGYRAQAVTYTIAYLSKIVSDRNKFLNFDLIWESQELPEELIVIIERITKAVYDDITNPPEGHANVSQWCKKIMCWESVKKMNLYIDIDENLLKDKEEEKYNLKEAKKEKKILKGIEIQVFVVKISLDKWRKLFDYYKKEGFSGLSSIEKGVLKSMSTNQISYPTERQSKVLYKLYIKASNEGFIW